MIPRLYAEESAHGTERLSSKGQSPRLGGGACPGGRGIALELSKRERRQH